MSDNTYEERLLYTQSCTTEEGAAVKTNVYAIKWAYPGSVSSISSRVRITAAYEVDAGQVFPMSGVIEKWSDKGWLLLDDYCESNIIYNDADDFLKALASIAFSFITATPIGQVGNEEKAKPIKKEDKSVKLSKPDLKVLKFKTRSKDDGDKNKKPKDDNPDFDWV